MYVNGNNYKLSETATEQPICLESVNKYAYLISIVELMSYAVLLHELSIPDCH